ncbi:MAG: hypothetical protein WBA28_08925 [Microbacteriaceae bacterium]
MADQDALSEGKNPQDSDAQMKSSPQAITQTRGKFLVLQVAMISFFLGALILATIWAAIQMILLADPTLVAMGIALLVLCAIGAWALWMELSFGVQSQRLLRQLDAESPAEYPSDDDTEQDFHDRIAEHPDQWQGLLHLGLYYAAHGQKQLARQFIRKAIQLNSAQKNQTGA